MKNPLQEVYEPTPVLIAVKTYPLPSRSYGELVCTAGITRTGDWVRLYPVDFRYRPPEQQFSKYQWIEVGLLPHGSGNDSRKESRKPDLESIRLLGPPLSPEDNWRDRRRVIDPLPVHTMNQLKALHEEDRTSLGIVRPSKILDLKIEPNTEAWKPEWQAALKQFRMFGPQPLPLRKIPFKFSYVFECQDSDKPHNAMIEDWELGVLWLREVERLGNEYDAAESVRQKFFDEMCGSSKETKFFVGTVFPYNTWVVIGVFWPPLDQQGSLFDWNHRLP